MHRTDILNFIISSIEAAMKASFLLLITLLILFSCNLPSAPLAEGRAVWLSRFEYAHADMQESKNFIDDVFRKARLARLNMIIFQVRGNGDAFYQSTLEPWGEDLTGVLGKNPGWDPLQYAIDKAHEYGLELHAWVNTFPAWKRDKPLPDSTEVLHPMLAHPEWMVCDSTGAVMNPEYGYLTFSPGNPEVRQHTLDVVDEIVSNYDIDGLHFDYIRYPEWANRHGFSHDKVSIERFNSKESNPDQLPWEAWQREQVNIFVRSAYNQIIQKKPWVKVSAAVIGSHQQAEWNGYFSVYQDAREWLADGKMDIIFPMTYTPTDHATVPYLQSIEEWNNMQYLGRHIMPGIPVHKIGRGVTWSMVSDQIRIIRERHFPGMAFYSATRLASEITELDPDAYPTWANVPACNWKSKEKPAPVENVRLAANGLLTWAYTADKLAGTRFNIYCFESDFSDDDNPEALIYITRRGELKYKIPGHEGGKRYAVSAINRFGNESLRTMFSVAE
jgi:uncharacterized lipoprotein YddW (UPF0748 family)